MNSTRATSITCIINVKNGEKYIRKTLESVINQTVQCVILVIDNHSIDNTKNICKEFSIVKFVATPKPMTLGEARNFSLNFVETEFVAWLDADDLWHPKFVEANLLAFNKMPEAQFANSYTQLIDINGNELPIYKQKYLSVKNDFAIIPGDTLLTLITHGCAHWCSEVFRTDIVRKVEGFDISLDYAEDWDLLIRIALVAKQAVKINANLSQYRVHPNQATKIINWRDRFLEIELMLNNLLKENRSRVIEKAVLNLKLRYKFFETLEIMQENKFNVFSIFDTLSTLNLVVIFWLVRRICYRLYKNIILYIKYLLT